MMAGVMNKVYQHIVLDGIISQAFALDYDVVIFTPFMAFDNDTAYQRGENKVYELANFELFDAVIYVPCSYINDRTRILVETMLEERCPLPVIALESDDARYTDVMVDDFHAFQRVVDHLIEEHHVRKIYCLTGFKDNLQAEERQRGYRHSMETHGLPVGDGYVIYGDFWKQAALDLAEKLFRGEIEKPEAIVCCCDTVALTLCNRLIELGIRVPEDIIVVGYDASDEAAENVPSVTTYARPLADLGMRSVLRAHEIITGETAAPVRKDQGHIVTAESCGCGKDFMQKFEERQIEIRETEETRKLFEDTPMAEKLNDAATLNELLEGIMDHFYLIHGWKDWYLCLCDQWDDLSKNTDNVEDYNHYTDTMHLRIRCAEQNGVIVDETFPLSDLLPALHEERAEPRAYYVTPLHFNERCFGYAALGYGNSSRAFDALYHSWSRNINNALEFMRVRNNFASMNQRLFLSSVRDTLTGIYNRHGFTIYADEIYARALSDGLPLLIIAADLDGLKIINDSYGHLEGDIAITAAANALSTCCSHGEVCARTGGDEFLVIGCGNYTEELIAEYTQYIQDFLDRFNAVSGKPYEVSVSVGWVCQKLTPEDSLNALTEEADARMYREKVRRKKQRQ